MKQIIVIYTLDEELKLILDELMLKNYLLVSVAMFRENVCVEN